MSKGKVELSSPVARVVKPFGKEGEAVVALFDNFPEDYDTREPLFVIIDGLTVPLFFDRFDRRGTRKAVVLFADFYAEKRVAELVGHELFCSPSGTAETEYETDEENDDLIYLDELVGFEALLGAGKKGWVQARRVKSRILSTATIRYSSYGSGRRRFMFRRPMI